MPVCHLCIFFGEACPSRSLTHFVTMLLVFFMVSFKSSLYIWDNDHFFFFCLHFYTCKVHVLKYIGRKSKNNQAISLRLLSIIPPIYDDSLVSIKNCNWMDLCAHICNQHLSGIYCVPHKGQDTETNNTIKFLQMSQFRHRDTRKQWIICALILGCEEFWNAEEGRLKSEEDNLGL